MDAAKLLDDDDPKHRAEVVVLISLIRVHAREHFPTAGDCPQTPCPEAQALAEVILAQKQARDEGSDLPGVRRRVSA